ncbi:hypothetical protein [Cellulophaga baltica]|uniref:hypothetical protein n=1 Tax=Cellulophaga baltica TaxID=76594 RepID=UPI0024951332|nr:hypothetical protein [Cellulophaga baltica]
MKKFRNFAQTLTDLKEFMFVEEKGNELNCYEVKIEDYHNRESKTIKALVLEVTEYSDKYIITKKQPIEYVELEVDTITGIPLLP